MKVELSVLVFEDLKAAVSVIFTLLNCELLPNFWD